MIPGTTFDTDKETALQNLKTMLIETFLLGSVPDPDGSGFFADPDLDFKNPYRDSSVFCFQYFNILMGSK